MVLQYMGHHRDHPINFPEHRHLIDDAKVLLERYRTRDELGRKLTTDERRAWVGEMVIVMERLQQAVMMHVGLPDYRGETQRRGVWLHQFACGLRPVQPLDRDPENLRPRRPYLQRNQPDK